MFRKTIILLFSALVIQGYILTEDNENIGNIIDDLMKVYHALLDITGEVITGSNQTLNTAFNDLKHFAEDIELDAKHLINGTLNKIQKEIDKLNQKAEEAGIEIGDCAIYEEELVQLPNIFMDQITTCITDAVNDAQKNLTAAMNEAYKIEQDFNNIEQEIDDCKKAEKPIVCYNQLLAVLEMDVIVGPRTIEEYTDEALVAIANAPEIIKECSETIVNNAPDEAKEIVDDFAKCLFIH